MSVTPASHARREVDFAALVNASRLYEHIETAEDADYLRSQLDTLGVVAFVADGAVLPRASSFDPSKGKREVKITSKGLQSISFGTQMIDLGAVEQLVDISQTRAIGDAIYYATRFMDGSRSLREIASAVQRAVEKKGLDVLNRRPVGDYAAFRGLELTAAINRLRTLEVTEKR
ncbi:MAG: hypothetical protein DRG87_10005 [Deltaproteobacteria bacterium]|nr:MAG: hypothetical protein DRG87_10005 [Deltaproteobacteria bacterium]